MLWTLNALGIASGQGGTSYLIWGWDAGNDDDGNNDENCDNVNKNEQNKQFCAHEKKLSRTIFTETTFLPYVQGFYLL